MVHIICNSKKFVTGITNTLTAADLSIVNFGSVLKLFLKIEPYEQDIKLNLMNKIYKSATSFLHNSVNYIWLLSKILIIPPGLFRGMVHRDHITSNFVYSIQFNTF